MLHAVLLAIVLGPEQFVGEPAQQPLLAGRKFIASSNGNDLAIASEGDSLTIFRVDPNGGAVPGIRPATGAIVHDIAGNGRTYATAWSRGPENGINDVAVTMLATNGTATTTILEQRRYRPAGMTVASNGRDFLVAWESPGVLNLQLLDEQGRALRAAEAVRLNTSIGTVTAASNGSGFLVAVIIERMIISLRVSSDGVASGPVEVTTQGGQLRALEWMGTHYLLVTGLFAFGRAHLLDATGRPFGNSTFFDADPQNAVRHGNAVIGESQGRLYRVDSDGRIEAMSLTLPPRTFRTVSTLASNGVDLFYIFGEPDAPAQLLRLGGAEAAKPFGLIYRDQHAPQAARAAGLHAVVWREGGDWFASRVRGGMRLDGRGVAMPFPSAVASDGMRSLLLFAGGGAWPVPESGPFPVPTGVYADQPMVAWTGRHFVAVSVTTLGRAAPCFWEHTALYATLFAPDGTVVQPRKPLGIEGEIVLHSVVGNGDGFVLAWRYSVFSGCNARFFIQTQSMRDDLTKGADLFPAKAVASDGRGTTVFTEDGGIFTGGRIQAKAAVGTVSVGWSGTAFVLAKQTSRGIEVARWDPKARPLILDWAELAPEIATADGTAVLAGLTSSESGAVLLYTRITTVPGYGEWRRVVMREVDGSPSRRRAASR